MIVREPVALVTPRLAHHIERALWEAAQRARLEGYVLPEEVVRFLHEVRELAERYRGTVPEGCDAGVTAPDAAAPPRRMLDTGMAGSLAGVSRHAVAAAARRGRLPGQHIGGRWLFDEADVLEWRRRVAGGSED